MLEEVVVGGGGSDEVEVIGFVLCVLVGGSLVRVCSDSGGKFVKWLVWNSGLVFSRESPGVLNGLLERHPIIGIQFFLAPAFTGIVRICSLGFFLT